MATGSLHVSETGTKAPSDADIYKCPLSELYDDSLTVDDYVILLHVWSKDKNYDFQNNSPVTSAQADIFLRSRPGPYDHFRVFEDSATLRGLTLHIEEALAYGIPQETIDEWFGGVEIKFKSQHPDTFEVDNYSSVKNNSERAGQELDRIVASRKAYYLPFEEIPSNLSIAPGSLVIKPDRLRYVTDWSNSDVNLNQECEEEPVNYKSLNDLIENFVFDGYWFGLDLKDCFSHWPLAPSCRRLFGFRNHHSGETGCFLFLPQGLSPSPGINDRQIKQCVLAARRFTRKVLLFDFVDDIRGTLEGPDAKSYEKVLDAMETTVRIWTEIGLDLHGPDQPKKFILPTKLLDWIGFTLCSTAGRIYLQDDKYIKIIQRLVQFKNIIISGELPKVRVVASITGLLNWSLSVVQKAHIHLKPFYQEIIKSGVLPLWQNGCKNANPTIKSTDGFIQEIQWWENTIRSNPYLQIMKTSRNVPYVWTPQFLRQNRQLVIQLAEEVKILTTDASGEGWGATIDNRAFQGHWGLDISRQSSNYRELRTILEWIRLQGHDFQNSIILVRIDNVVTVHYINKGSGRFDDLTKVAVELTSISADNNIIMVAEHIRGCHNTAADSLSRFMDFAGPIDPFPNKCLATWAWNAIQARLHIRFQMEAFTDPDGNNSRLTYRYWENQSIFQAPIEMWRNVYSWWFPPAHLRHATFRFIKDAIRNNNFQGSEKRKILIFCPVSTIHQQLQGDKFIQIYKFKKNLSLFHVDSPFGERLPNTSEKWGVYRPV